MSFFFRTKFRGVSRILEQSLSRNVLLSLIHCFQRSTKFQDGLQGPQWRFVAFISNFERH